MRPRPLSKSAAEASTFRAARSGIGAIVARTRSAAASLSPGQCHGFGTETREGAMKAYLVGGGIASLAAATYLIRDGGVLPANVTIFEAARPGNCACDVANAKDGFILPTGRIFEEKFRCSEASFRDYPLGCGPLPVDLRRCRRGQQALRISC
jgi:hypothetical protein